METRPQGTTLFTGICLLSGILVIIQLWLVAAALDALLAHDFGVLIPSAVVSLAIFLVNAILLGQVVSFDRRLRRVTGNG